MRNVSKKFKEAMETRRDFYAVGEITFADGTQKTISKEDFSQTGNSIVDSAGSTSFPLGMLIPKQITISLMNDDDRWSEYDFYWATIHLMTKFDFDDGTTESLNIGTFTVISPENYGTTIEITAMDDSYKTDKPYDTKYTYPMSMGIALQDCCETCGITLFSQNFANRDYEIPKKPENLTHRQFIGLCAMIAGGNARFDEYNRLKIISYDFSPLENLLLDGGSFNPWTEGDSYDGGTFNPWTTGTTIDGGTFGDRDNIHVLYQYKSGIVIEVDDVVITGVQMSGDDGEGNETTYLYGEQGYVLTVDNQLAEGKENEVLRLIGDKVIGMTFRPFSGDHIALPTAEFMDLCYVIDRKQNIYKSVLTDVTFNFYGFTNLKCSADSPIRNSSTKLGNDVKAIVEAKKLVEREKTARERAIENLANQLSQSNGLYMTADEQDDGSTIYYMHDKPSLSESMVVWKLTANAFGVSTDGGKTYPYGFDANGVAILERIYAIGLDADYIKTGAFEIRNDDGTILVLMDKDTKEVILRPTRFELSDGSSIEQTVEKAAGDKAKTFLSQPTPPYHKGDLWYGGTSSEVKVCVKSREEGVYVSTDWEKRDKYVDSATASAAGTSAANTAIQNMTQTQVLDKLTNGGTDKGIYLLNGKLYISFSAMRGEELTLGGTNNANGIIRVLDSSGGEIGKFDNTGFSTSNSLYKTVLDKNGLAIYYYERSRYNFAGYFVGTSFASSAGDYYGLSLGTPGGFAVDIQDTMGGSIYRTPLAVHRENVNVTNLNVTGSLSVRGDKDRLVETDSYGERLLYCYEMPSPMFGDIGEGVTDEYGECCVLIDDIFSETISDQEYQVFIQKEGKGDLWVAEKSAQYFIVKGTENLKFSWEIKAKQRDFPIERLDNNEFREMLENSSDNYDVLNYLDDIESYIKCQEEILYEAIE